MSVQVLEHLGRERARELMGEEGPPASRDEMRRVAIHEAAHAVALLRLDARVHVVEIRPDGAGFCMHDLERHHKLSEHVFYVGTFAEMVHGFPPRGLDPGDCAEAERWAEEFGRELRPRRAMRAALNLMLDPEVRADVRAIANALLERGRLMGPELRPLLQAHREAG